MEDAVEQAVERVVEAQATAGSPEQLAISIAAVIFVLAMFVGLEVISKVPAMLHTPLMSVTNAISSVIVVGALVAAGAGGDPLAQALGGIAVGLACVNIFGGFAVTNRMLAMYKKKKK